jgi:hypothetical protein
MTAQQQQPGAHTWPRGEPAQAVTPAQAAASSAMGAPPQPPASGDRWASMSPEERARRAAAYEAMTPEQRAQVREQRRRQHEASGSAASTP